MIDIENDRDSQTLWPIGRCRWIDMEAIYMDLTIKRGNQKFYIGESGENFIAEITWTVRDDGALIADHTFVDNSLRGQGVAAKLLDHLTAHARDNQLKIVPLCPYISKAMDRNPAKYEDVRTD